MVINPLDRESLRSQFAAARPFPFAKIDGFLDPDFAGRVASSYPAFETALGQGATFKTVNEKKKVQITDATLFPAPVAQLNDALASPGFLADLSFITGIPELLADPELVGGGMHLTGPGGRLDVHLDFNYIEERKLHRRLNLLIYLNPKWSPEWGGQIQLWDKDVEHCAASFDPVFNRCVIFETSNISFHGVVPVSASAPMPRQSFATYFYTRAAPAHWDGTAHSTIFKARPEEKLRGLVMMPAESIRRKLDRGIHQLKGGLKHLVGR